MGLRTIIVVLGLSIVLAGIFTPVRADIYRCESDGVIEFSDTPCRADPEPYRPTGQVSVVGAADDLEQTARLNQAFIEQRLEHQAQQRLERERRAAEAAERERQAPVAAPAPRAYLPFRYRAYPRKQRYPIYPHAGHRLPRATDTASEQRPFSALSGPFPGTRRLDREP